MINTRKSSGRLKYISLCPLSGYLTRQISFLLNNYKFNSKGKEDVNDPGLLIPRYVATGRTAPNGSVYGPVVKKDENNLVPVRSIVTKKEGNLYEVTPDMFSKRFLKASIPDDSAIGFSLGTSMTENITQSTLGLKHGGHERVSDITGNLYAPKNCEFREEGKWIILKVRGGELKYPRPINWVGIGKDKYKEGDLIGTAYNTTSPIYRTNSLIKLLNAKGGNGVKYFEKDNVIISDCYAYEPGIIHYTENKKGEIEVTIGGRQYTYSDNVVYYYPDGEEIKQYQRFCSGVVNMRKVASDLGNDISGIFNIFRKQFYSLNNPKYLKTGYVEPSDMQEEVIETVFSGLISEQKDPDTNEIKAIEYQGTQNAILGRKSFFTTLSYGWSSKTVGKALKGEVNLEDDIMTETVLHLILEDKLDK